MYGSRVIGPINPSNINTMFADILAFEVKSAAGHVVTLGYIVLPFQLNHYNNVIMRAMAPQITSVSIVCSTVYSDAYQIKYQSSASLAIVSGIHRWLVNCPHKGPVTRKKFSFDDVIVRDRVMHICVSKPGQYWFKWWLIADQLLKTV